MKIVVAPDKFKGSLNSFEVCDAIAKGILTPGRNVDLHLLPMADGGDGFASVMRHYHHTTSISCKTLDPLGRPLSASYEWNGGSRTAIIELAVASGLVLLDKKERNPLFTSTMGTGLMIRDAISRSAQKIVLGLGGSATNDAGTGLLAALGFVFLDKDERPVVPNGDALLMIEKVVPPAALPGIVFQVACDVRNPLYGKEGAAFVFAPQKGADDAMVQKLDEGLRKFSRLLLQQTGRDISAIPGAGAAGGTAAGLMAFFSVDMQNGIELVAAASGMQQVIADADLLITGEGKLDAQSAGGKVVGYMAALARRHGVRCRAICGELDLDQSGLVAMGIDKAFSLVDVAGSRDLAIENARELLTATAPRLLQL